MKRIAPILVIVSGWMWGSSGVFVRFLTEIGFDNSAIIECRLLIAAIILIVSLLIYNRGLLKFNWKDSWVFIFAGACSSLILNFFLNIAINTLSLSFAAVLLSTMPVYVIFLAALIFKEKITFLKILCVIIVFFGCVCVSGLLESDVAISAIGIISGLLAGFGYALYSIFVRFGLNHKYHPLTITTYSMVVSAIIFAFLADWGTIFEIVSVDPGQRMLLLIAQSAVCAVLPYSLFNLALKYIDTGTASILASCEPVAATVFGFIIFKESPTVVSITGQVIVLFALAVLSKPNMFKIKNKIQNE